MSNELNNIGGESDLPDLMVGCFLVGAIVPCFNLMQSLGLEFISYMPSTVHIIYLDCNDQTGVTQTATELSQWDNLPDAGLQALHIAYTLRMLYLSSHHAIHDSPIYIVLMDGIVAIIEKGSGLYMFSCQFFFIPIGLCLASHLSFKTGEVTSRHIHASSCWYE
jgi:hypothetical protein